MTDAADDHTLKRLIWRGYQLEHKRDDILTEIAATRVAFAATRGVPADICICHQSVGPRIPPEAGLTVLWWEKIAPTVWYWGNTASAL